MKATINQRLEAGIAAHEAGDLNEAEWLYRSILQSQPAHPEANHNLGVLAISINDLKAALPLFKTALEGNSQNEQFWLSYIEALIIDGQFDNARQILKQAREQKLSADSLDYLEEQLSPIAQNPDAAQVHPPKELLDSLLLHYQSGRLSEAERLAVKITQDFPTHQLSWKVLGAVLGATGRKSEAIDANKTAVALAPLDPEAHSNLGVMLEEVGRLDEAEVSYKKAIEVKPDYADAHYNFGMMLQELGRLDEAEASYKQAIVSKPDYADAHYNLGIILKELGRLDEAGASYTQAIAFKSDYAEAHNNLGSTYKELGRLEEAETSYRKAIEVKPDFVEAHTNLGNTLEELDRVDEAEASYTDAIELRPDFDEALYNRSYLLFDKGEYTAALKDADGCALDEKNKALPLISLHALGDLSEIYKRLEDQSKSDAENIALAAFAAFIAEKEKKPTAYNFCPHPLDFVHVANLSSYRSDSDTLVGDTIEELHEIKAVWEPSGKTTVNGFQSLDGINLFKNPTGNLAQLKKIIIDEIDAYHFKFKTKQCSYIQKFPKTRDLFGWTVILKQQGHQNAHIHPSGWMSGIVYLRVVPSLGKDEGAIEFSLNGKHYHDADSPGFIFQPQVGDIVFFPSSLHHKTIPFTTDMERIIVSFDLLPESAQP